MAVQKQPRFLHRLNIIGSFFSEKDKRRVNKRLCRGEIFRFQRQMKSSVSRSVK